LGFIHSSLKEPSPTKSGRGGYSTAGLVFNHSEVSLQSRGARKAIKPIYSVKSPSHPTYYHIFTLFSHKLDVVVLLRLSSLGSAPLVIQTLSKQLWPNSGPKLQQPPVTSQTKPSIPCSAATVLPDPPFRPDPNMDEPFKLKKRRAMDNLTFHDLIQNEEPFFFGENTLESPSWPEALFTLPHSPISPQSSPVIEYSNRGRKRSRVAPPLMFMICVLNGR
jgi:hypothetical protein